jgi:hypothetical protein
MVANLPRPAGVNGAEGIRTPDLLGAIQALSQLSYSPGIQIWDLRSEI